MEFSREWNVPVHHFLFRHVYWPARCNFSQPVAMVITFLVSSIFHELVMSCITKKLRGYGFLAMMLQLPIVAIQKSRFFRGRTILNVSCYCLDWYFAVLTDFLSRMPSSGSR
jgi:sterol O-acyltransferase